MNTNRQSLTCPVCLEEFNTQQRIPKVLPHCGHSICETCLIQILEKSKHQCPLDKTRFGTSCRTSIDDFNTNDLGMQLLPDRTWNQCPLHNEKRNIVCLTDKVLVCSSCVIFGDHKGHEVKLASEFQDGFKQKETQLRALSDKIEETLKSFPLSLQQARESMKNVVEERFKILRFLLEKEELNIKKQIDDAYSNEKLRFEKMIPEVSHLQSVISDKLIEPRIRLPDSEKEQEIIDLEEGVNKKLIQVKETSQEFRVWRETLKSTYLQDKDIISSLITQPINSSMEKYANELEIDKLELDAQVKALLEFEHEKQRSFFGEHVFPLVKEMIGDKYAPKVTGMLIDLSVLNLEDILDYLSNAKYFQERVDEAMDLLREEGFIESSSSGIHVVPQHEEQAENGIEIAV